MKYSDGTLARLGDKVQLWSGCSGVVVSSIDTGEYTNDYPENDWAQLGVGIIVLSDAAGLVHIIEPDEDLVFLGRGQISDPGKEPQSP